MNALMRCFSILSLCFLLALNAGCDKFKKEPPEKEHGKEEAGHGEHEEERGAVHLKEESQKLVGLELVKVNRQPFFATVEVVGEIAQESENVVHMTCPEPGKLKSFDTKLGDEVDQGTPICVIETRSGKTLEIKSEVHGFVLAQYGKPGDSVDTLTTIVTIVNPDILRASFSIYEKDLAGIQVGQKVKVKSIAYPNKIFDGEIVFISPGVDEKTRTVKARVNVNNEEHLLKFGMFVTGEILIPVSDNVLVLPLNVIQKVEGENVVFVPNQEEPGEFLVRKIKVGRKTETDAEILEGLEEGDEIVGKGSFYLKSELLKGELEEGHAH